VVAHPHIFKADRPCHVPRRLVRPDRPGSDRPEAGDYTGAHDAGLLWSMTDPGVATIVAPVLTVHLAASLDGRPVATTSLTREWAPPRSANGTRAWRRRASREPGVDPSMAFSRGSEAALLLDIDFPGLIDRFVGGGTQQADALGRLQAWSRLLGFLAARTEPLR